MEVVQTSLAVGCCLLLLSRFQSTNAVANTLHYTSLQGTTVPASSSHSLSQQRVHSIQSTVSSNILEMKPEFSSIAHMSSLLPHSSTFNFNDVLITNQTYLTSETPSVTIPVSSNSIYKRSGKLTFLSSSDHLPQLVSSSAHLLLESSNTRIISPSVFVAPTTTLQKLRSISQSSQLTTPDILALNATVVPYLETVHVSGLSTSRFVSVTSEVAMININKVSMIQSYTSLQSRARAAVYTSFVTMFSGYPSINSFAVPQPSSTVDTIMVVPAPTIPSNIHTITTEPFSLKLSVSESLSPSKVILPTEIEVSSPLMSALHPSTLFLLSRTFARSLAVSDRESYDVAATADNVASHTVSVVSNVVPSSGIDSNQPSSLMQPSTGIDSQSEYNADKLIQQLFTVFDIETTDPTATSHTMSVIGTVAPSSSFQQSSVSMSPPFVVIDSKLIDDTDSLIQQPSTVFSMDTTEALSSTTSVVSTIIPSSSISSQQPFVSMPLSMVMDSTSIHGSRSLIQQASIVVSIDTTEAQSHTISVVVPSSSISSQQPLVSMQPSTTIDLTSVHSTGSPVLRPSTVFKTQAPEAPATLKTTLVLSTATMSILYRSQTSGISSSVSTSYRQRPSDIKVASRMLSVTTAVNSEVTSSLIVNTYTPTVSLLTTETPTTTQSSKLSIAVVAGAAAGGGMVVMVFLLLIFCLYVHHYRKKQSKNYSTTPEVWVTSEIADDGIQLTEISKEDAVPEDDYDYFIWTQRDEPFSGLFQPSFDEDDETSMSDHRHVDIDGVIYDIPQSLLPRTLTEASGVYDRLEPIDPNKQLVVGGQIYDIPRKLLQQQNAIELSVVQEVRLSPVPSDTNQQNDIKLAAEPSSSKQSLVKLPKDLKHRARSHTGPV